MNTLYNKYSRLGIIREGHFLLTSGRHSNVYIDKDAIYRSSAFRETIKQLTEACLTFSTTPTKGLVITGPAVAGAVLAAPVWREMYTLSWQPDITFVYPEKINGGMVFRRGYDMHLKGKEVIIIEDIITTGSSVTATAKAITDCGGKVIGCACIWNRTFWTHGDFPIRTLINRPLDAWPGHACKLCQARIPLIDPKGGGIL